MRELGDISLGRANLGDSVPVIVYRLLEFAIADILEKRYGKETSDDIIRESGHLAGISYTKYFLNVDVDFETFIDNLEKSLSENKIGILRIEHADLETGNLILSVYEDLDCSGLPVYDENVCVYDEGFIAGILEAYTGKKFKVGEVDCWANGARVCRFVAKTV